MAKKSTPLQAMPTKSPCSLLSRDPATTRPQTDRSSRFNT